MNIPSLLPALALLLSTNITAAPVSHLPASPQPRINVQMPEEQKVGDTMRQLGFTVTHVRQTRSGTWEVDVSSFDAGRASSALRGTIKPLSSSTSIGLLGSAVSSDENGSATGSGGNPAPEGSGGGRNSGEGGTTSGGNQGGVEPGTNPRQRSRAISVSLSESGVLIIDKTSLRAAGLSNAVGSAANGKVTFR